MKEELMIKSLCEGIETGDSARILSCYCEFARIVNPLVGSINGRDSRYLPLSLSKFLHSVKIECDIINANASTISVLWRMRGILRGSEKRIVCHGKTVFGLSHGRIQTQVDSFNFWKLSRDVYGTTGLLFGWIPVFRYKFHGKAYREVRIIASFYKNQYFSLPGSKSHDEVYSDRY